MATSYFWKKREIVLYGLSIMVLMIHLSTFYSYQGGDTAMSAVNGFLELFLTEGLPRFAVPMFFMLSGAVFFKTYTNARYKEKLCSRVRSLLIPYLIWNTVWMLFECVCSYTFIASYFAGREKFVLTVPNVLEGIFHYGNNIPFWFIFELMFFVILSPLIDLIIRNRYIGVGVTAALLVLAEFDIGIPTPFFFSREAIVYYLVGALVGKYAFDKIGRVSSRKAQWISIGYFVLYLIGRMAALMNDISVPLAIEVVSHILAGYAVWNMFDLLGTEWRSRPLYTRSFAVYAIHSNVCAVITKLVFLALPAYEWLALPNFVFTMVATLAFINGFCVLLQRIAPRVYAVVMGER